MLENLLVQQKKDGPSVYVDIDFEDSVIGSNDMFDKISETNLSTRKSATASTTESSVILHAEYGKVMQIGTGRMWWIDQLAMDPKGLIIELEGDLKGPAGGFPSAPIIGSGGYNAGNAYLSGIMFSVRSGQYPFEAVTFPNNSGSSLRGTAPNGTMEKWFIEREKDGKNFIYGLRSMPTPLPRWATDGNPTGLFIFGQPMNRVNYPTFTNYMTGFVKSIKVYRL